MKEKTTGMGMRSVVENVENCGENKGKYSFQMRGLFL